MTRHASCRPNCLPSRRPGQNFGTVAVTVTVMSAGLVQPMIASAVGDGWTRITFLDQKMPPISPEVDPSATAPLALMPTWGIGRPDRGWHRRIRRVARVISWCLRVVVRAPSGLR